MYFLISIGLLIAFAISGNGVALLCSALFAIADALYSRNKNN